jgi:glutamate synthase (NADPH/NADH) small chain
VNQDPVAIKQVEVEIIDHAFREGWVVPQVPSIKTGKRVAVIGSGPAGLAVAQQLTRAGHDVVVLERADRIGGLLRYGIPEFKMEKVHLDRRLEQMRGEGTEFRTNADVGGSIDIEVLRASHDAIVLACGATAPRDLNVPGRELQGIHQAMGYLPIANRVQEGDSTTYDIDAKGKNVVIIGGGDTGADCLGTALRQGAKQVIQLEIMPRPSDARATGNPWPQFAFVYKVTSAHEEGGERMYSVNTERFIDDGNGNVRALLLHEVEMVNGKFEKKEGSDLEIPADLVFLAMGFTGPEKGSWLEQLGVAFDERGNVIRNDSYESTVPGVFVAGDMGRGQSLIVWAIAEGRACAAGVDTALMGETSPCAKSANGPSTGVVRST